jgi:hypothetical protein
MPIPNSTEDLIRELLSIKTEDKNLDFKESFNWEEKDNEFKLKFVKDLLSMSNTLDGGKILIGVRDKDFEFVGMTKDDFESFDTTKVNDFFQKFTDPIFCCSVHKHIIDEKYIVLIDVPEFDEEPIICKRVGNSSNNSVILRVGGVYVRTDKGTSVLIPSSEEMRKLLGRSLIKKRDSLLKNIDQLLKGKTVKKDIIPEDYYKTEIQEGQSYLTGNLGGEFEKYNNCYWEVCSYPTEYNPHRFPNQTYIRDLLRNTEVNIRGWRFPYTDTKGNSSNFEQGRQSFSISGHHIEGYQIFQSGLFMWNKILHEEIEKKDEGGKVLMYEVMIIIITEYFLFLKRFYENLIPNEELEVKIGLRNTKDKKLSYLQGSIPINNFYVCKIPDISIKKRFNTTDLIVSHKEISCEVIRGFFRLFNCDDIKDNTINSYQIRYLDEML